MVEMYWSRIKGNFVDKFTGKELGPLCTFTGTVREWYETLIEVMVDVENVVVKESGGDPITGVSWEADPDVTCIIHCSVLFKPGLPTEFGVIGSFENLKGMLRTIPLSPSKPLVGTKRAELVCLNDGVRVVLGSVTVLDYAES
jgi:hypothetical protein